MHRRHDLQGINRRTNIVNANDPSAIQYGYHGERNTTVNPLTGWLSREMTYDRLA